MDALKLSIEIFTVNFFLYPDWQKTSQTEYESLMSCMCRQKHIPISNENFLFDMSLSLVIHLLYFQNRFTLEPKNEDICLFYLILRATHQYEVHIHEFRS